MDKKIRIRFTYDDEIILLREFVAQNPIEFPEKWNSILEHMRELTGKQFTLRTIKKHINLLLGLFHTKEKGSKVKSGIEEVYSERDHLLQEVDDMTRDKINLTTPAKKKKVESIEIENARQEREAIALHTFLSDTCGSTSNSMDHDYGVGTEVEVETDNGNSGNTQEISMEAVKQVLGPHNKKCTKIRSMRRSGLEYLKEKSEKDNEIRMKEIQLEERKLNCENRKLAIEEAKMAIESKKIEIEMAERQQRLELERQRLQQEIIEKKNVNDLITSQQILIDNLLKKLREAED